ncbi:hypothetical protein PSOL_01740 [Candidatus Phytoplasma solani]
MLLLKNFLFVIYIDKKNNNKPSKKDFIVVLKKFIYFLL